MKPVSLAVLALLSLSPPLWAQVPAPPGATAAIPEGTDEPPPPGTVLVDAPAYVEAAVRIDMYEIAMAKLAIERTADRAVAAFAEQMLRDHDASMRELQAVAYGTAGVPVLTLDTFHNTRLAALKIATDFDRAYLDKHIESHMEAVRLHGGFAGGGSDPALRGVASRAEALALRHLQEAQALRVSLGPPS